VVAELQGLVGPQGGQALKAVVDNADATPELGTFAGIVSLVTLLFSVSGVFGQLQAALNRMWDVKAAPVTANGNWLWIEKRLLSVGAFLSVGFLLVVSLAVTAVVEGWTGAPPGLREPRSAGAAFGLSLVAERGALCAHVHGATRREARLWRDTASAAWRRRSSSRSVAGRSASTRPKQRRLTHGAAGSLVVVLVWVYYASLVVFWARS
jgi:membrane protein